MWYDRELRNDCQIFRNTGLLDAHSVQKFVQFLEKFLQKPPKHFILDLSQVEAIDSSGISVLVESAKSIQRQGGTLQVVDDSRVAYTIKLVRLEKFLSLSPSLEEALARLKQSKLCRTTLLFCVS